MGCTKVYEYEIVPVGSYRIRRNCSGCGKKSCYRNTNRFRINANGNRFDVWLIYQCETCGHTYNLTIWERVKITSLGSDYEKYQKNDRSLAEQYGNDRALLERNRAELEEKEREYELRLVSEKDSTEPVTEPDWTSQDTSEIIISIYNPCGLHLRVDKLLAELLGTSRAWVKEAQKQGKIQAPGHYIGTEMKIIVKKEE